MQYIFNREGKEEIVQAEKWGWGVVYKDGSELKQFGDDGVFHQIKEIEQEKIAIWVLYKMEDPGKRIDIPFTEGMKIIHKYRRFVFNAKTPEERTVTVYIFGWHKAGVSSYAFILPDDRVVMSPDDNPQLTAFNL